MFASVKDDAIKILPTLTEFITAMTSEEKMFVRKGCIYDNGDGPKFCESPNLAPKESNVINGAIFKVIGNMQDKKNSVMRFFPGCFLNDGNFVPGQRMASVKGEFIPGASLRSPEGTFQFIPGVGMISHKMSLITIFGHKHFRQKFHKKFDIFHEKISTASDFG